MSAEFGDYNGGYMHGKIDSAAIDCNEYATNEVTKQMGTVLDKIYPICYQISKVEQCDSSGFNDVPAQVDEVILELLQLKKIAQNYKD